MITLKSVLSIAVLSAGLLVPAAQAYSPDPDMMKIKGYSPSVIEATNTQRSRQEWRQPTDPVLSPVERFFHNIYYNDYTGGLDEFGSQVIREQQ